MYAFVDSTLVDIYTAALAERRSGEFDTFFTIEAAVLRVDWLSARPCGLHGPVFTNLFRIGMWPK